MSEKTKKSDLKKREPKADSRLKIGMRYFFRNSFQKCTRCVLHATHTKKSLPVFLQFNLFHWFTLQTDLVS